MGLGADDVVPVEVVEVKPDVVETDKTDNEVTK